MLRKKIKWRVKHILHNPSIMLLILCLLGAFLRVQFSHMREFGIRTGSGMLERSFGYVPAVSGMEICKTVLRFLMALSASRFAGMPSGAVLPAALFLILALEAHYQDAADWERIERRYSLRSLILMFFIFSFGGWIWEVCLHAAQTGNFVNRGVLHGPWLPIYGTGAVAILVVLEKFRRKPLLQFLLSAALCGCVEYAAAYCLEAFHGQKWWDYNGSFLNIQGRVCGEGLLLFGLGGMMIVYVLAPFLDTWIAGLKRSIVIPLCAVLILVMCADQYYSAVYPNVGKGITSREPVRLENQKPRRRMKKGERLK